MCLWVRKVRLPIIAILPYVGFKQQFFSTRNSDITQSWMHYLSLRVGELTAWNMLEARIQTCLCSLIGAFTICCACSGRLSYYVRCNRVMRVMIWLRGSSGWSGPSLLKYASLWVSPCECPFLGSNSLSMRNNFLNKCCCVNSQVRLFKTSSICCLLSYHFKI